MAGEVKGKVYEAITKVALELAIKGNRNGWKVLWHEQPEWISIEADLAIGTDANDIQALILVTHSTSEGYSQKKFWRNAGELFQWKVHGTQSVKVLGVLFDAAIKPAVRAVEEAAVDASLNVAITRYGKQLIRYVAKDPGAFGKSDDQRENAVRELIDAKSANHDRNVETWMREFADDLKNLLRQSAKVHDEAWDLLRKIDRRKTPKAKAKNTYVRNGLAKLMLADAAARQYLYDAVEHNKPVEHRLLPKYTVDLGLVTEEIDGCYVKDPEIQSAIQTIGRDDCEVVIAKAPGRMADFIDPLRSIGNIEIYSQFVVDHFDELRTASGMKKWLKACYDNPVAIVGAPEDFDIPPRDTWLFVYCMTLEKAAQKRIVAYGLSNLAAETGYPEIGQGGFVVPPFVHRERPLPNGMLTSIAKVFADKVSTLGQARLADEDFRKTMKEMLVQRQMYILSTYRNFDPIAWLIQLKLAAAGLSGAEKSSPSFLNEVAGASSATSTFIQPRKDTLIYWQSVTDAGRVHKTKELSARFRATKIRWDGIAVSERPSAKRMYFVADGEWRDEDLAMLIRSGVDAVFYPDQVSDLVAKL